VKRSTALAILRLIVTVGLLALVCARLDWRVAATAVTRVRPVTLLAALALSLAAYLGRAVRWVHLLRHGGVRIGIADAYRITLVGIFYGLLTPGRVGELGRAWHLDLPRAHTLPSVIWDRLTDVLLLELLSIPAFLALGSWRGALLWTYLAVVAATLALVLALDSARMLRWLARVAPWAAARLDAWRGGATGMLRSVPFARGMLWGLFFYAVSFAGAFLLLSALVPGRAPALLLVLPVIILLGNLPLTFGGLGLREQVAAMAFGGLGAPASAGPVFSLLWFLIITVTPALIGFAILHSRWGRVAGALAAPGAATGRSGG
jgi:uncharacterized protein (TIRG00374 family)